MFENYMWLVYLSMILSSGAIAWLVFDKARGLSRKAIIDNIDNPTIEQVLLAVHDAGYALTGSAINALRIGVEKAQAPDSPGGAVITSEEARDIAKSVLPALWGSLGEEAKKVLTGFHGSEDAAKQVAEARLVTQARDQIAKEAAAPLGLSAPRKIASAPERS